MRPLDEELTTDWQLRALKGKLVISKSGRNRAVIENVIPEVDGGRYPIKRVVGESVEVEADVFADGHDVVECVLLSRNQDESVWSETPMRHVGNDRWRGSFEVERVGRVHYTVLAWVDHFQSWIRDLQKRPVDGPDIDVNLRVGANLISAVGGRADARTAGWLQSRSAFLIGSAPASDRVRAAIDPELAVRMRPHSDRQFATQYDRELVVVVDRVKARYSTWYELFPRSWATEAGRHGTFRDVEAQLPRIAGMGFDVLYLPPIHPIGRAFRKGKNNTPTANPQDVGSPWGIGAAEGGHTAIHPELGTIADFRRLVDTARKHGIELALDVAYQCSPDHPWVKDHPDWFRKRPDGSIQYAENPPKKYQDIYPIDFESEDWQALWTALAEVFYFWIGQGVAIFRVDNPHTKAFPFWEWLIGEVKAKHPETIFLAEAFTRPKVMYRLAKLGFTQSYTYFSWRNTGAELKEYFTELTQTEVREYFRPNLWPNTPDILPEFLQWSGRAGFMARIVLAATLGASYGIYGPAFELGISQPIAPGKEEYLDSEKYQIVRWSLGGPNDLSEFIARLNRIRNENPALQSDRGLRFHICDNPEILCYSKYDAGLGNRVVTVVNLDPKHKQSGWIELDLLALGIEVGRPYQMHDLLTEAHYLWHGGRNFVLLDPEAVPAHVFRVRQHVRTEHDFDYFT
ncbi:MAG TPA: alpha-1,4-glucan--maltose-1-phosphate maltosyltransferase [Fimbriiglobus sp.]